MGWTLLWGWLGLEIWNFGLRVWGELGVFCLRAVEVGGGGGGGGDGWAVGGTSWG